MKMQNVLLTSVFGLAGIFIACGPVRMGGGYGDNLPEIKKVFAVDGLKAIRPGTVDSQDNSTYDQNRYVIAAESRVLIRFEDLMAHKEEITQAGQKLALQFSVTNAADKSKAIEHLKLCPLTRNWMMLATWTNAHFMNPSGKWSMPGSDYDESGCISPVADNPLNKPNTNPSGSPSPTPTPNPRALYFDLAQWFLDYPQGRSTNFGFAFVSDTTAVEIFGDRSSSESPRFIWYAPR